MPGVSRPKNENRRPFTGSLGKTGEIQGSEFQKMYTNATLAPIQKSLPRANAGHIRSESQPSVIARTGSRIGKRSRSFSTHCLRRITDMHIAENASTPNSRTHQSIGTAHTPQGILRPAGTPLKNRVIEPSTSEGAIHDGMWGCRSVAHWFSGVAK